MIGYLWFIVVWMRVIVGYYGLSMGYCGLSMGYSGLLRFMVVYCGFIVGLDPLSQPISSDI